MKWPYAVAVFLLGLLAVLVYLAHGHTVALLQPAGPIAGSERMLILQATALMLIVIVPTIALAFFFAWHYRAGNTNAHWEPEWEHARMDELVWWAIPFEIVLVLGALTWSSTHALDPHMPIQSAQAPLTIQVVALPWKWLFIYPDQHIASVNMVEIPVNRPVKFEITADAPINSFWIPQLGGQIMAMTGMVNPLYLEADKPGEYQGFSANYSGEGFADMHFIARAAAPADFDTWVASVGQSPETLDQTRYATLAQPATSSVQYFGSVDDSLYSSIVAKFMGPAHTMKMGGK